MFKSNIKKPVCILVEAIGTAAQLVSAFKDRGFECVHIQSQKEVLKVFKSVFTPEIYLENIPYDGNFSCLLKKITAYNPVCLLAGIGARS